MDWFLDDNGLRNERVKNTRSNIVEQKKRTSEFCGDFQNIDKNLTKREVE